MTELLMTKLLKPTNESQISICECGHSRGLHLNYIGCAWERIRDGQLIGCNCNEFRPNIPQGKTRQSEIGQQSPVLAVRRDNPADNTLLGEQMGEQLPKTSSQSSVKISVECAGDDYTSTRKHMPLEEINLKLDCIISALISIMKSTGNYDRNVLNNLIKFEGKG